jgi:hypothetical protein
MISQLGRLRILVIQDGPVLMLRLLEDMLCGRRLGRYPSLEIKVNDGDYPQDVSCLLDQFRRSWGGT